jgi:menaquinone-9 beta-reductase
MTTDVLVIGGGPAGAAAAARVAAGGLRVTLCERQREPGHQVCGEFVSATATAELAALGVEPIRLGARPITRTRICGHEAEATSALPFIGYGVSRARLDRSLLQVAAVCGAEVRIGVGVRRLERRRGVWSAALSEGGRVESGAVVLATGKHDLRGHARAWSDGADIVAFKMHCRLGPEQAAAMDGAVELFVYDGGYAGLQLIERGVSNLCFVLSADRVRGAGRAWQNAISYLRQASPPLDARLRDVAPLWNRPLAIARVPYGYVCGEDACADGLYRVGDQVAVVPSLAGEGIAIALRSARHAAEAVLAGDVAAGHVAVVRNEVLGAVRRAGLIDLVLHSGSLGRLSLAIAAGAGLLPLLSRVTRLSPAGNVPAITGSRAFAPGLRSPGRG